MTRNDVGGKEFESAAQVRPFRRGKSATELFLPVLADEIGLPSEFTSRFGDVERAHPAIFRVESPVHEASCLELVNEAHRGAWGDGEHGHDGLLRWPLIVTEHLQKPMLTRIEAQMRESRGKAGLHCFADLGQEIAKGLFRTLRPATTILTLNWLLCHKGTLPNLSHRILIR